MADNPAKDKPAAKSKVKFWGSITNTIIIPVLSLVLNILVLIMTCRYTGQQVNLQENTEKYNRINERIITIYNFINTDRSDYLSLSYMIDYLGKTMEPQDFDSFLENLILLIKDNLDLENNYHHIQFMYNILKYSKDYRTYIQKVINKNLTKPDIWEEMVGLIIVRLSNIKNKNSDEFNNLRYIVNTKGEDFTYIDESIESSKNIYFLMRSLKEYCKLASNNNQKIKNIFLRLNGFVLNISTQENNFKQFFEEIII